MPLFQVTFKKRLSGYEQNNCREIYTVEKRSEALENVYARYGKANVVDAVIEELGSNSKASNNVVSESQGAIFGNGNEA
jgi:hypothetical protein